MNVSSETPSIYYNNIFYRNSLILFKIPNVKVPTLLNIINNTFLDI